jgi:hypothetical protein
MYGYIEGSSNNKALEISNATGVAVNYPSTASKKQSNGAGRGRRLTFIWNLEFW